MKTRLQKSMTVSPGRIKLKSDGIIQHRLLSLYTEIAPLFNTLNLYIFNPPENLLIHVFQ